MLEKPAARFGAVLLCSGLTACADQDPIVAYRAPKEPPKIALAKTASAKATAEPPVRWKLPEGWSETDSPGSSMRFATFVVDDSPPRLELTVMVLPKQNLGPNLARWAGQAGLPPRAPDELDEALTALDVGGHPVHLVDFDGPTTRVLAALADHDDKTWSFKISGESKRVEAQKEAFQAFVRSLQFRTAGGTP